MSENFVLNFALCYNFIDIFLSLCLFKSSLLSLKFTLFKQSTFTSTKFSNMNLQNNRIGMMVWNGTFFGFCLVVVDLNLPDLSESTYTIVHY